MSDAAAKEELATVSQTPNAFNAANWVQQKAFLAPAVLLRNPTEHETTTTSPGKVISQRLRRAEAGRWRELFDEYVAADQVAKIPQ